MAAGPSQLVFFDPQFSKKSQLPSQRKRRETKSRKREGKESRRICSILISHSDLRL